MDGSASVCPECGATTPEGGTCRDNFHALLLLESEVPGGPGGVPHFYAVASYGLQHPGSMNYTAGVAEGLRAAVAGVLDGRATLADIRRRTRATFDGPTRVTRRGGEPGVDWYRGAWPLTVTDVLAAGVGGYAAAVERWARSVLETLDTRMR
jgi:Family of unknown function (DUF5946)